MEKLKLVGDRVLILPAPAEQVTASGIYIPDTAKEKPAKGKVIAIGEGQDGQKLTVSVDDQVLYGKFSGSPITVEGEEYLIMRESEIIAIIQC